MLNKQATGEPEKFTKGAYINMDWTTWATLALIELRCELMARGMESDEIDKMIKKSSEIKNK